MVVVVVPYRPVWPSEFELIAAEVRTALAGIPVIAIEHAGSTSVPGLAAKPVIDIDVIIDHTDLQLTIPPLEAIGYEYTGDCGIPFRFSFKHSKSRVYAEDGRGFQNSSQDTAADGPPRGPNGESLHLRNLYVTYKDCLSLRNHLGVRDVLRADPQLRDEYGAIKLAIAADTSIDIFDYLRDKTPILSKILARVPSITDEERAEIASANVDKDALDTATKRFLDRPRPDLASAQTSML